MKMAGDEPVSSGRAYTLTEVDGRPPAGLVSCVGERTLTLALNDLSYRVYGSGVASSGTVRFYQKDLGPDGKDVRVWTIRDPGGTPLIAEHCPPSEPRTTHAV